MVKRVLLDTNIYGIIVKEQNPLLIVNSIEHNPAIAVYGIREILRKELRSTPKNVRAGNMNLRIFLLQVYDALVRDHDLSINKNIHFIADRYYAAYRSCGGIKPKEEIGNDLLIIACAVAHGLDVVISEDNRTMLSISAVQAYTLINETLHLRTPVFISYEKFKRWFS